MNFLFTEEQRTLQASVRAFLDKECTPADVRAAWDDDAQRTGRWRSLAQMGVLGLTLAEEHGGMGLDETWLVLLLEEAGRAALPEPLGPVTAAAGLLQDVGPARARQQYLPEVASGDALLGVLLPGRPWVDDAALVDYFLIASGESVHGCPAGEVDITPAPSLDRGRRRFSIFSELGPASLLADGVGDALRRAADRLALGDAAYALGTGRRLIELSTEYALQREQFGVLIGSFQAIKHQLADALVQVEFAAPAVYRAAWSVAHDAAGRSEHVAMAARLALRAAHVAARTALQVHGAIGYTDEHDLQVWLRTALNPAAAVR